MKNHSFFFFLLVIGTGLLAGCQAKPVRELAFADAAVKAARRAKAENLATELFRKAENHFLRAQQDYREGYFDSAKKFADDARKLAEQAEYQAALKQAKVRSQSNSSPFGNE